MARRLYRKRLQLDCWATLGETGNHSGAAPRLADLPDAVPDLLVGRSELCVLMRCPDEGEVDIELWAGEPGPRPEGWRIAFEGMLETASRGFDLRSMASFFHLDARPGTYRVRAETHRGDDGTVDAVRFILPESPDLSGKALF